VESIKERVKRIEEVYKSLVQLMLNSQDTFVRDLVYWIKKDEEFFQEFVKCIDNEKRAVLLSALRRILIESSEKICSS